MNPEKYGTYVENQSSFLKRNYITLETLNTIFFIADDECWKII
jgi:hypothetical protein